MGKTAGPCSHVLSSGTRLFRRKTERPGRLPGCVVTHRSKQQQALYVQLQAFFFFFLGQSLWGTVSSTVPMAAWPAPPTLRQPLRSLHLPSSAFGNTCASISLNIAAALQNSKIMWAMAADTWVWAEQPFPNARSNSLQGFSPRLALWACDLCLA